MIISMSLVVDLVDYRTKKSILILLSLVWPLILLPVLYKYSLLEMDMYRKASINRYLSYITISLFVIFCSTY